jgi:hypothetical protein
MERNDKNSSDNSLNVLLNNYSCIMNIRENCMKNWSNTNIYFGFILVLVTISSFKYEFIFLFIPFLIITQFAIILFTQYHQFVAEVYLSELENKINDLDNKHKINYFIYYNHLFNINILKNKKGIIPFIKPTAILFINLSIIYVGIFIYSTFKGTLFLEEVITVKYGVLIVYAFPIVSASLFILTIIEFVYMPKYIKPLLRERYFFVEKNGA